MRNHLIHLHTSGETKPIGLLKLGELAIQHNTPENSRIYIDTAIDSTNSSEATIVEFVPKSYMDKEVQRVMELIGNSSGDTGDTGNTGSTIDKSDYICDDPNANPIIVTDDYSFDNIPTITPCIYDFSQLKVINIMDLSLPKLTSITANMESLEIMDEDDMFAIGTSNRIKEISLYIPKIKYFRSDNIFKVCTELTKFKAELFNLINGANLFNGLIRLKTVEVNMPNLTNGNYMFIGCSNLTSFTSDLSSLTYGSYMFSNCSKLTSWDIPLPKLTDGYWMFYGCTGLTSFTSDLSNLTDGYYMFYSCSGLTSWNIPLPNLMNGTGMFSECTSLSSFTSDLSSLTDGNQMFEYCSGLTSWDIPLPNLTSGYRMFYSCSSLTSFTSDLSNLTDGENMFNGCSGLTDVTLSGSLNCNRLSFSASTALTVDSMVNIINALVDRTGQDGYTLELGSTNLAKLSPEQKAIATNKNWTLS